MLCTLASVSEHQPTSWSSFYFDLQVLVFLFPAGLYFCFSKLTDANIFIILYGVLSIYFAVSLNLMSFAVRSISQARNGMYFFLFLFKNRLKFSHDLVVSGLMINDEI